MSLALLRLSILGGALLSIAGCGGSASVGSGNGGVGGGSPTTVTISFTGASPGAVAAKIGSGTFTAATLSSNKLTLSLPSGTTNFAVAYVCTPISGATPLPVAEERIVEASALDGVSFTEVCPDIAAAAGATGILTGSVDASAISAVNELALYAENAQSPTGLPDFAPLPIPNGNFSFAAPAGTDRVMVVAYGPGASGIPESHSLVAARNFSSQTVPGMLNGGNTVVLGTADQTTTEPLTYQNVPSGYSAPTTLVDYQLGDIGISVADATTSEYPALPANAMESGDNYLFWTTSFSTSNPFQRTEVTTTLAAAGPVSFTFPPAWPYAGPTPAAQPSFDLAYTGFSGAAGVFDAVEMNWASNLSPLNVVLLTASANYVNGSTTVAIPDLTSLSGFLPAPPTGTLVSWSAAISQGRFPSLQQPSSNTTLTTVSNIGSYTVP